MLTRFARSRSGSVIPMLALSFVPIMAAVAGAVDYSHANWVKSSLQDAVDSTALMLAKNATTQSSTQLQTAATSYFLANFTRTDAQNPQVTATYTQSQSGGFVVTVNGTTSVTTNFMNVLGISHLPVSATGSVNWNNSKLRVALVLDNTGSMNDNGKITALKTATHNLLTQLQSAATTNGDVYVSIIPFVKDVDVGASNYNASWIDWTDWDQANGTCSSHSYTTYSSCISHSKTWTHKNHNTWNGCITDRDQNYDTINTAPSTGSTLFPAEQYSYCPAATIMGQSYNWTALNSLVDTMTANGSTNQAIGLAWGWQSLTQSTPLNAPALDSNYQYQQIIILLTDGLNTQDRWYGNGSTTSTQVDARQQILCTNIKAAGITVYTVQVDINNSDPKSTLLQNCASDANKFFLLTSANQIVTTFDTIGTSLAQLHLSK
jgi:Flp pilus assembly protein TadG